MNPIALEPIRRNPSPARLGARAGADAIRYHDLRPFCGLRGVGLVISGPRPLLAAVFADAPHGAVGHILWQLPATDRDPRQALAQAFRQMACGFQSDALTYELLALAAVAPCPSDRAGSFLGHGAAGRTPEALAHHRALARKAFASADIPDDMREALFAMTDHGRPDCMEEIMQARRSSGSSRWDLLAFFSSHPGLAPCLTNEVLKAACGGAGPREALRAAWPGLSDAHVRRLRGDGVRLLGAMRATLFMSREVSHAMSAMAALPPERVPAGNAWTGFASLARLAGHLSDVHGLDRATLLGAVGSDWNGYAERLLPVATPGEYPEAPARTWAERENLALVLGSDIADPAGSLAEDLLLPLLCHVATRRAGRDMPWPEDMDPDVARMRSHDLQRLVLALAPRLLYGGKSLARVAEVSAEWHAPGATVGRASPEVFGSREWPPLLPEVRLSGGLRVVPVHRPADLAAEGSHERDRHGVPGLGHCVATRLSRYRSGEAHLLSVRRDLGDGTWERLSCAEVRLGHRGGLDVVEHRGRANEAPPREAADAIAHVSDAMREGKLVAFQAALVRRAGPGESMPDRCGYDWRDPATVAAAAASWDPLLPRWLRGLTLEGRVEALVAEGALAPDWEDVFSEGPESETAMVEGRIAR